METPRPAKRARSGSDPSTKSPLEGYTRGELWFDDGNVILVAEKTAFRVYQGVLSKNSEIFRDMFTIPQPADAEKLEGCPVVHLSDSQKDLERFLSAVFDLGNTYYGTQRLPFSIVSAMLRLGTKYGVDFLRESAIGRLRTIFPPRLSDFHNAFTEWALWLESGGDPANEAAFSNTLVDMKQEDLFEALNLVQSLGLDAFLPQALYCCACIQGELLLVGHTDVDGYHHELSSDDLKNLYRAQFQFREEWVKRATFYLIGKPVPHCLTPQACAEGLSKSRNIYLSTLHAVNAVLLDIGWTSKAGLCPVCMTHATESITAQRDRVWNELAEIFELEVQWPIP
ncbi:hypothetical protein EIP91_010006 [Steccherinum ochraceum]|uniref:BTB domain-containing protein n=1 Tax=Steccherinum ochraceum TaxID=92696 RepID=A0A4R0RNE5_9APHY|nr:hypothetical protein EIP91_010006 [Steccherinum ochraceum]